MMVNKKISNQNYLDALMEISHAPSYGAKDIEEKYKISKAFTTVCVELGFATSIRRGLHKWILNREPTRGDVAIIKKRMCVRHLHYSAEYKKNQLTIKPLKRVERIAPVRQPVQPVQQVQQVEEQHTPYPIMDVVIAFLAGMIAAGFVSLIWK